MLDDAKQTHVMRETIDAFVTARLLMTNDSAGVKTIEVSHEAVIREWPRLASWLKEARDDIPLQQAVSDDAEEWVRRDRPKDRLYRGTQLKEAQSWAARYMVSERELIFLRASESQRQRSKLLRALVICLLLILVIPVGLLGVPQLISFAQQNNLLPINVTSNQDTGPGSLTSAIQVANPKNSTIHFDPSLKGNTIFLTNNLILDKSLTLIGPGVTISSGKHDYEILVDSRISVTIDGLSFKQGLFTAIDFIHNYGALVLDHTTISDNSMLGTHQGLIYNDGGQLTILNSIITNNNGEIYNTGGPMTITNSIITNMNRNNPNKTPANTSPPIYNDIGGSLTIRDSTIANNISYFNGGGIFNGGVLTISGSTISSNSIPSIPGSATNSGGGIANDVGATLTITNSTIADNTAGHYGGGITNGGTLMIINSTIARNIAGYYGGGVSNLAGTALMSFCTVYGNSASIGGGIAVIDGSVTLSKSIVAGNTLVAREPPFHRPIMGTLLSQGFNLMQNMANIVPQRTSIPDTSNIAVSRFTPDHDTTVSASDLTKIFDPQGPQNNGGQTKTYMLLPGTGDLAIDAIPLASCHIADIFDIATHRFIDQRGAARPHDNEQFCDIGAYESSD